MKIEIVEGGFSYNGEFYKEVDGLFDDIDCDGVNYEQFCNGRQLSDAQQETADFILQNKRCYVFNGMGTGKTMSAIMAVLAMLRAHNDWRFLIITTKTVLASGWIPEVESVCPWFPITVCDGTPDKKKKILNDKEYKFVGVSADSLHLVPRDKFQMIIADEATLFKGAQGVNGTQRGKNMCELASSPTTERLILMTGTPRAHNCMDAYGLYYVMNDKYRKKSYKGEGPHVMNKSEFRNSMCLPMSFKDYMTCKGYTKEEQWNKWKNYTLGGVFANLSLEQFKERLNHSSRDAMNVWIERQNANETLMKLLSPAIAFRTEDVLDLPECPIIDVKLDISEEDRAKLNQIKKEMIMDFTEKQDIIANKMVLEGKMEQMNCGLVYDSEGNGRIILPSVYNQAMRFVLMKAKELPKDRGLVIASRYNHVLYAVKRAIEIVLGEGTVNLINGSVSSKLRTQYVAEFRSLKTRILLANTACLSHGVTLVEAKEMILMDTPQYTEPYVQVKGRVHRRGQKWEIPIYRIMGNATVSRRFGILEGAEERDDDFVRLVTTEE